MAGSADRLIQRVQRWLQSAEPAERSGRLSSRDLTELEARVQRLRVAGDRWAHVELSPTVARCAAAGVSGRVGGECVAKDA